jgi:hypothetical protein
MKNQIRCDKRFSYPVRAFTLMIILFLCINSHKTVAQTDVKQHHAVISFDPLGFVTFGPSINAEVALGKFFGLQTGFRILNLGLCTDLILNERGGFLPDMKMSWTVNIKAKFYIKPREKLEGFFLGPSFDYGRSAYEYEYDWIGEKFTDRQLYNNMVFGLGVGYKWIWRNGFSLEPSYNMAFFLSKLKRYEFGDGDAFDYTTTNYELDLFALYVLSIKVGIAF